MAAPINENAPINRYPAGFLSLLDLKTMGKTPSLIDPRVQASIEMLEFYLLQAKKRYQLDVTSVYTGNVGSSTFAFTQAFPADINQFIEVFASGNVIRIPQTEVWCITRMSCGALMPIGSTSIDFLMDVNGIGVPSTSYGFGSGGTPAVAGTFWARTAIDLPLWVPGGAVIRFGVTSAVIGAANTTPSASVELARFLV